MDIKQSLSNITGWAKKNPWLAGGIVLVLVLVAWWVSKQGGGSSGGSVSEEEEALPTLDIAGGGSDFASSGMLDAIQNNTGGVTQAPPQFSSPQFDSLPAVDALESGGWFDPGALQDAFYHAPTISPNIEVMESSGIISKALSPTIAAVPAATAKSSNVKLMAAGVPSTVADAVSKTKSSGKQTPAQKVGKGKNFTGSYLGIYYVLGYPATGSSKAPANAAVKSATTKSSKTQLIASGVPSTVADYLKR